jgi:hypothetical protein
MAKKKAVNTRYRMTKLEKFYIDNHLDTDAKSLAIELGIPEPVIDRYQKKITREQKKEEEQEEKPTTTDDFMIKNEKHGTVSMTQAASMQGDATRGAGLKSKYYQNAIKKIR